MKTRPKSVGIVGLGQIGGSIGLALRECEPNLRLVGTEIDPARAKKARSFLDAVSEQADVLEGADWIILAVPVRTILELMPELFARFPEAAFLDTGSTKQAVVAKARSLGEGFRFVGGHPLAGSEKAGEAGWNPNLFQEKPFFLTEVWPNAELNEAAEQLVTLLGAQPVWVNPETHDQRLAYSSHFAYLLSALYLLQGEESRKLHPDFLGSGFASVARLAGSSSEMGLDMLLTNPENVLNEIRRFRTALEKIQTILEENQVADLEKWLHHSESLWKEVKPGG